MAAIDAAAVKKLRENDKCRTDGLQNAPWSKPRAISIKPRKLLREKRHRVGG